MKAETTITGKIYSLEAIRGLAALYVFFHHAHLLPNAGVGRLLYFGQEAVIIFFLLSGFVISQASSKRRPSIMAYLSARAKRIYPIFCTALLVAYISACVQASKLVPIDFSALLGNLAMLQDSSALKPGVWFDTYYSNSPLWSLSYEWWFYMLYAVIGIRSSYSERSQFTIVTFVSIACAILYCLHPAQPLLYGAYAAIWWSGVELSREFTECGTLTFRKQAHSISAILFITIIWTLNAAFQFKFRPEFSSIGSYPLLPVRHFVAALIFLALAIALRNFLLKPVKGLFNIGLWFAPISFALYAIHQPIINASQALLVGQARWQVILIAFAVSTIVAKSVETAFTVKSPVYLRQEFKHE
ncbi:MAG: acyltransferase [Thiobacillus sp.]|nr:acyltransferase [Thiobacillus sp.]